MIRLLLLCTAALGLIRAYAQPTGPGDTPPRNCDAVNNLRSVEFLYATETSATVKYIEQTTVLNRSGNGKADFSCFVDPTIKLISFTGTMSDAQGKVVRKFKRTDLRYTEYSSQSLADDTALYYLECLSPTYPYTVRFEYELSLENGILGFPSFFPIESAETALEKGIYTVSVPQGLLFNHKSQNAGEPVRTSSEGRDIYRWTIEHVPAVKSEHAMPPLLDLVPHVLTAPDNFTYAGNWGNMHDWASYGSWMCWLLEGRGVLPEGLRQEVHQRTDTIRSPREKVRALYDYMGKSTRYVSIQLGIGGQQPMPVQEVYKTKFGDCKALSNYLRAMLAECGIPSDYIIIDTRRRRMHRDFASPAQANHAILCVPLENDTLWLECTNPEVPFGFIHNDLAGHDAIRFRNGTGEFVTLPQYADSLNRMVNDVEITINADGSAQGRVSEQYHVSQYDQMMFFPKLEQKKQTDYLLQNLKIPTAQIGTIACKEDKSALPSLEISYDVSSENYVNFTGNRCFIPQTPFHDYTPLKDRERLNDIYFGQGYDDIIRVRLRIPDNLQIESLPKPVSMTAPFGTWDLQVSARDGVITIEQHIRIHSGTYSRELFDQYRGFRTERAKAFNANIVLKKL